MGKDRKDETEVINIDMPEKTQKEETASAAETPDKRPVRQAEPVLDDPIADSKTGEDIYSGRYKRSDEDRGIYTGGTKNERIASQIGSSQERRKRLERRRRERRRKRVGLFLCLVAVAVGAAVAVKHFHTDDSSGSSGTAAVTDTASAAEETAQEVAWEENTNSEILTLVQNYYTALAAADTDTLGTLLISGAEVDADAIQKQGEIVESYQDISTHVTSGIAGGEYAVFIEYTVKFKDISTPVPGLEPAYVKTEDDGSLKLMRYGEDFSADLNADINSYMSKLSATDEITKLTEEVNSAYEAAQESDADLKKFIDALSDTSAETSEETTAASGETTAASGETTAASGETTAASGETTAASGETTAASGETTAASGETTAASGETTAASGETTAASDGTTAADDENTFTESETGMKFTETDDIQYTTTVVKLRPSPTMDGDEYVTLETGTWVHVTGISDKWMKVVLKSGRSGYIYRKFLSPYEPETEEDE